MPTYNADVLPSSTGINLGSASQRFNLNSQTINNSGNATVTGTLAVTGAQTLTGNTTCSGTLTVSGAATCSSTLAVTGASTLTGNVTCSGTLSVTGAQTFTGNTTCSGNLAVTGTSALTGAVTATGLVTGNGGFSGALNGTVGATTPNTGAFTTLTSTAITSQTVKSGGLLSGNTTAVTVNANSTSPQNLMAYTFVANSLNSAGRTAHIYCAGNYSTPSGGTPTLTFTLNLGAVQMATFTTGATTATQTTLPWYLDIYLTCASTGASGTLESHGIASYRLGSGAGVLSVLGDTNTAATSAVDLTSGQTLQLTGTFSTNAATANIFVQRQMVVEWFNV